MLASRSDMTSAPRTLLLILFLAGTLAVPVALGGASGHGSTTESRCLTIGGLNQLCVTATIHVQPAGSCFIYQYDPYVQGYWVCPTQVRSQITGSGLMGGSAHVRQLCGGGSWAGVIYYGPCNSAEEARCSFLPGLSCSTGTSSRTYYPIAYQGQTSTSCFVARGETSGPTGLSTYATYAGPERCITIQG